MFVWLAHEKQNTLMSQPCSYILIQRCLLASQNDVHPILVILLIIIIIIIVFQKFWLSNISNKWQ